MSNSSLLHVSVDEACRRFELAWHSGRPVSVDSCLPGTADAHYLATLEELVAIEMEFAWRELGGRSTATGREFRGAFERPPLVEDYLTRFPQLRVPTVLERLIGQEYLVRSKYGDRPSAASYRERFPDVALPAPTDTDDAPLAAPPRSVPAGYELGAEIGRGGMAVVYRAEQHGLDRPVAVKSLHPHLARDPEIIARFLDEARITGRLQHPGIPPVHEVGKLPDGRPFLAMKLIRGQTLDRLLQDRTDSSANRGRLVTVFEKVCEAVAYAHANGVIHRDLKPANVMVGDFGEVQVMDWGLAKHVNREQVTEDCRTASRLASPVRGAETTVDGTVLGTPAFMPPEQARGESAVVGTRSDVFGLGSILCAVLTGKPPFAGSGAAVRTASERGELGPAFARLDASGSEPDLIVLCKRCLAPVLEDRPADANEVARAVEALRLAAEERARQADRDRVRAEAEAREQRKRRKVQFALWAAVVAIGVLVATGAILRENLKRERAEEDAKQKQKDLVQERKDAEQERKDEEQRRKAENAREQAERLLGLARQLRVEYRFAAATDALQEADGLAEKFAPDLKPKVQQAQTDLGLVIELDRVRMYRSVFIPNAVGGGDLDLEKAPGQYQYAFTAHGFDVVSDPEAIAERVKASAVRSDLITALDDWAILEPNATVRDKVLACLRRADPDSGAAAFRNPKVWNDKAKLKALAEKADATKLAPGTIIALAELMRLRDADAVPLLRRAVPLYPRDFLLVFTLGQFLLIQERDLGTGGLRKEILGAYQAARAIRPDISLVLNNMGLVLFDNKDYSAALVALRKAAELDPNSAMAHYSLGFGLVGIRDFDAALKSVNRAVELNPKLSLAHDLVGVILRDAKRDYDGAIAAHQKALTINDRYTNAHINLGNDWAAKKDYTKAVAAFERAIEVENAKGLPDRRLLARAYTKLGESLRLKRDYIRAIAAHKKAIDIDDRYAVSRLNLGAVLLDLKDYDGAIERLLKAIELDKTDVQAHVQLGNAYFAKGDLKRALAAFETAINTDDSYAPAYSNYGSALSRNGEDAKAIAAYQKAIDLDATFTAAYANLALVLLKTGDVAGAVKAATKATEVDEQFAKAHSVLGDVLIAKREYEKALAAHQRAVKLEPENAELVVGVGNVWGAKRDWNKAIVEYEKAAALDPTCAIAYSNLGVALRNTQKYDKAIVAFEKARNLGLKDANIYVDLGRTRHMMGDFKGAIADYEKAISLDAKNSAPHTQLGIIYFSKEDYPKSIAFARAAIAINERDSIAHGVLGLALIKTRDYYRARLAIHRAVELDRERNTVLLDELPPIDVAPPPQPVGR